jgi:hypothetical protein
VVRDTVAREDVVRKRGEVTGLLIRSGIAAGVAAGRMNVLAERVMDVFPAPPMLGPPGTSGPRPDAAAKANGPGAAAAGPASASSAAPAARAADRGHQVTGQLRAIYFWPDRSRGRRGPAGRGPEAAPDPWTMTPRSVRAHVYDSFADPGDQAIAARHLTWHRHHAAVRIDEGTGVLWVPGAAGRGRSVESDGTLGLRVTQFGPQHQVLRETRLALGADARVRVSENCALLLVAADDDPGPVRGWTAATPLAQLAPQALLGPGVIVRPQAPVRVAAGGVRGTRAAGVTSGRMLAEANRIETPAGTRPGWIDTRFAGPPAWLRITLRPRGAAGRGSGPHGEPARVEARGADGHPFSLGRVLARAEDGLLQLSYPVPIAQRAPGVTVRVQPDAQWHVDAVAGVTEAVAAEPDGTAARRRAGHRERRGATVVLR